MTDTANQIDELSDEESPINIPHTDEFAVVTNPEQVNNTLAIKVYKGSYRKAAINNAIFEIGDIKKPFDIRAGKLRVQVKCHWYDWKPKESWIHITLSGDWELLPEHTGEVLRHFVANK